MLTLLLGKDWIANRDAILHKVAQDVKNAQGNRILMVPELISHDTERRLCMAAGDTSSRYAEVLSFTRLARRVADSAGHGAQECLDNGGRVVAMAAATRLLHSKLKAYAAVETRPEFLTSLVDAVDEFKRCCITSKDLLAAAEQSEGSFAQKLEELSLILEAYDSLCSRGKRDPRDQMTWLLEQLEAGDFAENHVFYIDGFPDFTRQHFAILLHLIQVSKQVVVSLNCDVPGSNLLAFEKAGNTAAELIRCAKQMGVPVEIRYVNSPRTQLQSVREGLFQGAISAVKDLQVYRTDSLQAECWLAAEQIRKLVRNGYRYRDISVVCTDMAAYKNTLSMVLHRCGIPLYLSGTETILEKSVIGALLSAIHAALGGFEQRDVLRYLKSVLSSLDMETCDRMENYAILWSVQGSRWLSAWENHPVGIGEEWTDSARRELDSLNNAREVALMPLMRLHKNFRSAVKLQDQVQALYDFLVEIQLAKRLDRLAKEMDASGDNRSAQILNQLWDILISALEQMYDVLGETVWDQESFLRLFELLLGQYDVGTIPPVLDAVTAGPVTAMRCQQVKHLILLGVQEGALPGYCGSSGVLTDQERDALRQMGVPLTGGSMEGLQAEFSEIFGVFCGAEQSICVSCGADQPSFVYRRLAGMAGGEQQYQNMTPIADIFDAAAVLVSAKDEKSAASLGIQDAYRQIMEHSQYALGNVKRENIQKLYGKKLRLSASQVDRQAECRMSYFLRYGLRVKERKEATVDPAEFGTYVHAVLEDTAREVMSRGGFHKVSLDETMEMAMAYSDAYAKERFSQLDSQRITYLFRRNVQELSVIVEELWRELSVSEFVPVDFELSFGDGQKMDAISIPNGEIEAQLRGFVDRVDVWNNGYCNYFRVVDYKTGRKDFDYCDVFNGIGLQMLLYLFALEQEGENVLGDNLIPAGVQYFAARSPFVTANGRLTDVEAAAEHGKTWKRKGLVLADDAVVYAMQPEGTPKRLSCKFDKDGVLTGDIANREQLKLLKRYVFQVLRDMVYDIVSGNVTPNPYTRGSSHNACAYCPYQSVCHFATVEGRRNYKTMTAQRFWEEIGREVEQDG